VGHLLSTLDTGETSGMEATTCYPDNLGATHQVVASRTCFCIGFVVLLAQNLVANIKESTNYHFFAHRTTLSTRLEVFFADGQSVVNKVFSSHCLPTDLTLATLRVIGFASQLDAISFDQILTYHARVLKFCVTFRAVRFPASFEEFPLDLLSTLAAFEALFVINFAKRSASLVGDRLVANLTFSYSLVYRFCQPAPDFCLNCWIVKVWVA